MSTSKSSIVFCPNRTEHLSDESQRGVSATDPLNNDDSYLNCQVCPDHLAMNDNIFTKLGRLSKLSFVSLMSGLT